MPKKKGELSIEERLEQSIVAKEEEPYKLPSNWVWTRLGEVANFSSGNGFPEKYQGFLDKNIPFYKVGNLKDCEIDGKLYKSTNYIDDEILKIIKGKIFSKNTIIFAKIGEAIRLNRRAILTEDSCIDNNLMAMIPKDISYYRFLYFWTKKEDFYKYAKATTVPSIRQGVFEELLFPLPPLEEQKRIVEKLDSLFEKIQKIKEIIEEVKEKTTSRREAILSKAFSGELTEKWRGENHSENARELLVKINDEKLKLWEDECKKAEDEGRKKPAKPKIKTIDEMLIGAEEETYKLPNNWVWTRLGDITDINPKKKILDFNDDEEISFVPMKAVSDETGKIEEMEYEKYSKLKKGYTQFIEEDVLFAKITPCMENGKCAIAKNLKNDIGYGTTEFHVLRCYQGIINKLLHIFLRQESFRKEAKYNMTGSVGFQRVPVDFLKTALFPLPPLEEQKEIVRVLDKIFEEENRISELISLENKIEILEKTILDRAFRGELGTGNNDDEPAIELLKKCLEER